MLRSFMGEIIFVVHKYLIKWLWCIAIWKNIARLQSAYNKQFKFTLNITVSTQSPSFRYWRPREWCWSIMPSSNQRPKSVIKWPCYANRYTATPTRSISKHSVFWQKVLCFSKSISKQEKFYSGRLISYKKRI